MTEQHQQDLQNSEPVTEPAIPTLPVPPKKNSNNLLLPLLIVGVLSIVLLCLIGLIGVPAFFIITNVERSPVEAVGTVVISKEAPAIAGDATGDDILFKETFTSATNGWETGAIENELGLEEVTIADGVYTLQVTANEAFYAERELPNQEFSNFVLTLDITPHDSQDHYSYGLTFRQNEALESYVIELGNDGLYAVFLFTGEWTILQDWTFAEAIKAGETNKLTIIADGNRLTFLVNGEPLTTIEDDTLSTGAIGLVVEIFEEGQSATVDFDNLVIRAP